MELNDYKDYRLFRFKLIKWDLNRKGDLIAIKIIDNKEISYYYFGHSGEAHNLVDGKGWVKTLHWLEPITKHRDTFIEIRSERIKKKKMETLFVDLL